MACINGSKLSPATRQEVLSAYGYRWTVENERRAREWFRAGKAEPPTAPLVTDEEWLADHAFHVTRDGRLDARHRHAEPACLADDWQP